MGHGKGDGRCTSAERFRPETTDPGGRRSHDGGFVTLLAARFRGQVPIFSNVTGYGVIDRGRLGRTAQVPIRSMSELMVSPLRGKSGAHRRQNWQPMDVMTDSRLTGQMPI